MTEPLRIGPEAAREADNLRVISFDATGLQPDTRYYYEIEVDGETDPARQGRFHTPGVGPYSFSFAASSCAISISNGQVFDSIREQDPLFFVTTGDIVYSNIGEPDPNRYYDAYTWFLTKPAREALHLSTSTVYMWDDHDYDSNNSDRTAPTREVAQAVYRDWVPSYPLVIEGETGPIYHAFTVGRVRFIVTDERSERSPATDPDNAQKTVLGAEQKAWFKQQLLDAKGEYPLIVWVQSVPWIAADASEGSDHWGQYQTEREELANFIADNAIEGLLMISGDAHMLAIDDGTNSDYATNGGGGFVVFQAAPLDRPGSVKGGPYSEGTRTDSGQFGLVTVEDNGATIEVTLSGRNYKGEEVLGYTFTVPEDGS
jgi:phosphodiesterase/alkaline phosphatase D-like protein